MAGDSLATRVSTLKSLLEGLEEIAPAVDEAQWSPAPVRKSREDTVERSKGLVSDPTPTIALDERRLRLRATVLEADRALDRIAVVVSEIERRLARALEAWERDG